MSAPNGGEGPVAVSALTGEGTDTLIEAIEAKLARGRSLMDLHLDPADGQGLHWLYEHTEVMARSDAGDGGSSSPSASLPRRWSGCAGGFLARNCSRGR